MKYRTIFGLVASLCVACSTFGGQDWAMKQGKLMTEFAKTINPTNVFPEYPRPQLVREKWLNLNGVWQFQPGTTNETLPLGTNLADKILVPFPVESSISGVMKHYDRVWYKCTFIVPTEWSGQRILLHFGAVDWESEVFVNGKSAGVHRGGYDPFSYDITPFLSGKGPQELLVRVFDPTENGGQPRGKQAIRGIDIMYTPTTGIWQPVWLEPVPQLRISDLKMVPNIDDSTLRLTVNAEGANKGVSVAVQINAGGKGVQSATGKPGAEMSIPVPKAILWTPENPFLYDLTVALVQDGKTIDTVASYFGMRKISVGVVDGYPRMLLNNRPVFQLGALDQGFWPDGIYTAPTDAALRFDLEQSKALGFNMVRKHVKVEPYRWYYWADKLGLLVWQDMPTAQSYGGVDADAALYPSELSRMIQTHWNSPSIVMWVVYNEKCGQDSHIKQNLTTPMLVQKVKELDPSRLVNQASGYDWYGAGDVADSHTYPAPQAIPGTPTQVMVCGEYGGTKFQVKDHCWGGDNGIEVTNLADYLTRYESYCTTLCQLKSSNGLSGAVFTQLTDVETELNGIFTYDRKATKADLGTLKAHNLRAINQHFSTSDVLPTSQTHAQSWKYTTKAPATNWFAPNFEDQSWSAGSAPFASDGTPGIIKGTTWATPDIWLRKQFDVGALTPEDLKNLFFNIYHDEDCEIYLNGTLAFSAKGFATYSFAPIDPTAKASLKPNAPNQIAVHCHQTEGGQGIDVGLQIMSFGDKVETK